MDGSVCAMSADHATASPELPLGDPDHVEVDEALLDRLEAELGEVAEVLEALDRIPRAGREGAGDVAAAVRDLLTGRFVDDVPADEVASDLVGDGELGAVDQVEALAEDPVVGAVADQPAAADVGDAAPVVAEAPFEVHDHAAVRDRDDLAPGTGAVDRVEGAEHPFE